MKKINVLFVTQAAIIAALYVVLTFVANVFGLASGVIQVRISEALTVLAFFTPAAVPGLAIGCFLANLLTGCAMWDVVFGTLATLLGAMGTYALGKYQWLAPVPPIIANTVIVPWVLRLVYGATDAIWFLAVTVGIGEVISCGILGTMLLLALKPHARMIFKQEAKTV